MKKKKSLNKKLRASAVAGACLLAAMAASRVYADPHGHGSINNRNHIRHVLLISVDGLHALDVANFVQSHPNSALAELSPWHHVFQRTHTGAVGLLSGPFGSRDRRLANHSRLIL